MSRKGVDINSIMCPFCSNCIEKFDHMFWSCDLSNSIWEKVYKWFDLLPPRVDRLRQVFNWINDFNISLDKNVVLDVISCVII